ncbi:MAG: universal stress protein, partial [Hydrogenophaga sp.]|nr:universal stress protein [Hydrogenophaga sp.]
MSPLSSILVATDFSAPSRHAAQRAAMLARSSAASLTLMHTLGGSALDDLRRWVSDDSQATSLIQAGASQRLQELADELGRTTGIHVQTHLTTGHPVDQVIK